VRVQASLIGAKDSNCLSLVRCLIIYNGRKSYWACPAEPEAILPIVHNKMFDLGHQASALDSRDLCYCEVAIEDWILPQVASPAMVEG
jgi:hypothetical protein